VEKTGGGEVANVPNKISYYGRDFGTANVNKPRHLLKKSWEKENVNLWEELEGRPSRGIRTFAGLAHAQSKGLCLMERYAGQSTERKHTVKEKKENMGGSKKTARPAGFGRKNLSLSEMLAQTRSNKARKASGPDMQPAAKNLTKRGELSEEKTSKLRDHHAA